MGSCIIATANNSEIQTHLNDFQVHNMAFAFYNTGSISCTRESIPTTQPSGNNTYSTSFPKVFEAELPT